MSNNNAFIDNMPVVASSITQTIAPPVINAEDIKRAFDECITKNAAVDSYAKIIAMYKTAQMFGKNCSVESLIQTFSEFYKQCSTEEDKLKVDKLCKNIANTNECIALMQKADAQMFIAFVLGYAYSVFSEKSS